MPKSTGRPGSQDPPGLVLTNCRVACVFSGRVLECDITLEQGLVTGLGSHGSGALEEYDCGGALVCPGFIDGHVHVESSLLTPRRFAEAVLPRGTTAVVCDPHEIANVAGLAGVDFMLEDSQDLDTAFFFMAPSCVPATAFETSGASLDAEAIRLLLRRDRVPGLAEVMNFPGVVAGDQEMLARIGAARDLGLPVDGHAPGLSGVDLMTYIARGVESDHECTTLEEAREKLEAGMFIYIRQGSTARNLHDLLPLVTPETVDRCLLVSDDRHPGDLLRQGHMDDILRQCVDAGLDPLLALRMATLNPARRFGLPGRGAVAPGYRADLVLVEDETSWRVREVFVGGRLAVRGGRVLDPPPERPVEEMTGTMHVAWDQVDLAVPAREGAMRHIALIPGQIVTREVIARPRIQQGLAVADPDRDICKLAVVERHRGTGRHATAFLMGLGLVRGGLASSVAHDSHNLIAAGMDDADMLGALRAVAGAGGGLAVCVEGQVSLLPLPVAGLMSDEPLAVVQSRLEALLRAAGETGCALDNPFMALAFLALPVIPELKLTDQGLFDARAFEHVDPWVGTG